MKIRINKAYVQQFRGSFRLKGLLHRAKNSFCDGWYVSGDEMSRSRKYHLQFSLTNNAIANLVTGTYLTGLLLALGAGDSLLGIVTMLIFAANLCQVLSPLFLERFPKRKKLLIGGRILGHCVNIVFIGLVPFLPVEPKVALALVAGGVFLNNFLGAMLNPGFSVWHIQSIPPRMRSRYFPMYNMVTGIFVALLTLAASCVVDAFSAAGNELFGLTLLRIVAALISVYDIYCLSQIKEYEYERSDHAFGLKDVLIRPFREKRYLIPVFICFVWNFTANMPGSYYTAYMLQDMGVSYTFITLVAMVNIPLLLIMAPIWRKFLIKRHWIKLINIGMAGYVLHYLLLSLVTKSTIFLYPISIALAYTMLTGINIGFASLPYLNMPKQNQTLYIGFYSAMANLGALLGVTIGRQLVTSLGNIHWELAGIPIGNKQILMVFVTFMMLLSYFVVKFLQKKLKPEELSASN